MSAIRPVSSDIAEPERAALESELAQWRARYAEIQQLTGIGGWEWDVAADRVVWTDELYRIYGYEPGAFEATYESFLALLPDDAREQIHDEVTRVMAKGGSFEVTHRIALPTGGHRFLLGRGHVVTDDSGRVVRLVGTSQDVTLLHEAEERAREATREQARRVEAEAGERRLRVILEAINDAFVALDRNWVFTYVNTRAGDVFGRAPESLIGRNVWEEFPESVGGPFHQAFETAMRERRMVTLEELSRFGGWYEARVYPSEEGLSIFFSDITERKGTEQILKESERKLQAIVDHAPAVVYAKDREGRFILVNRALLAITGRSANELLGRTDAELFDGELAEVYWAHDRQVLETGMTIQFEERARAGDEERSYLSIKFPLRDPDDRVYAVCGIAADITARTRAQEALLAGEERFRLAARATQELIYDWDIPGGMLMWSEAIHTVMGYPPEHRTTPFAWWLAAVHPSEAAAVAASLWGTVDGRAEFWTMEYRFRRHDGSYAAVRDRGSIIRDARGRALRMVGAMIDLTAERVREEQLRRAERLASLGTLVGGVAHELNNPLAAIKSFAQLMLQDPRSADDRDALEVVEREASRAGKIVADLRRLTRESQRTDVPREPLDLNGVVRQVLRMRDYTFRTHNVEVEADLSTGTAPILGNASELEQVILNLVVNAEDAMAEQEGPKRLTVRTRRGPTGIILSISDTGCGIPPENMPRIFDPFFTTKGPGVGTGLGLSMAHSIIAEHGGECTVESEPGTGTTVHVTLPPVAVSSGRPATSGGAQGTARALHVLVVDDEAPIRGVVSRYLRRRGHRVQEAGDGADAMALIEASVEDRFDVVLSDLRMPGFSGEQLITELQRRDPALARRLIFMTGDAASLEADKLLTRLGTPVVLKPFDLAEMAAIVEAQGA